MRSWDNMAGADRLLATLELDLSAPQLQGRLSVPGREARNFVGWLGLATAIEELLQPVDDWDLPDRCA